jgi:phosphoribosylpyrophosphate synthetase
MPENVEKHLFIFHGVFSNNALERLTEVFDKIFVSNSLPNYKESKERIADFDNKVVVFDVWE